MIGVEDGKQIVLENQNVVFEWATSAENNSFQLYDHDIFVNDVLLFTPIISNLSPASLTVYTEASTEKGSSHSTIFPTL